jgi:hypothetical protein
MTVSPPAERLPTGRHVLLRGVLPEPKRLRLQALADQQLTTSGERPLYIADQPCLGVTPLQRYRAAGVHCLLDAARPWLEACIGPRWLVLAGKVLLRRTWPLAETEARNLGHNASNLTWHQDSNASHGDRPMAVLMTVLQHGAGAKRPGLSLLEAPVREFEGVFGYQGSRVESFERTMAERYGGLRMVTPLLNAGDLLLFDGLTFHRTYAHAAMDGHRDALLVRVVRPEHAEHFPGGPHWLVDSVGSDHG